VFFFFGGENNNNSSCKNEDFAPARMPRRAKSFSEEEEERVGIFVGFEQRRTTGKILIDEE
jgi:hypothetical protein